MKLELSNRVNDDRDYWIKEFLLKKFQNSGQYLISEYRNSHLTFCIKINIVY